VLAHDGTLLGYITRKPSSANWRMLGALPRITLASRKTDGFPRTRECMVSLPSHKAGWRVVLHEGEDAPPNMEPA